MSNFGHQDWTVVTLKRRNKNNTNTDINNITQTVDYKQKHKSGPNNNSKGMNVSVSEMTKVQKDALNNDGSPQKIATIDKNIGQNIQAARNALNMSRKELGQKINEKETVIAEYENGKAIPNHIILNKIEKVLQCKVRK